MSPHAATFQQALRALDTILGWRHRFLPIEYGRDKRDGLTWHSCHDPQALARLIRHMDEMHSEEIAFRLPEARPGKGVCGSTVLWARTEGAEQTQRAFRLRPMPTMVLREGGSSRRLMIWALERWVDYFELEDLNKRLAYHLRAKQCDGLPEALRIPVPGTCLRVGRARPVPVVVSRLEAVRYDPQQVAGRLRKPPEVDPSKWRRAA